MKKILFAIIFAYATVSFSACENKSTTADETTDTTTLAPVETTDSTATDTTSAN